MEVSPGSKRSWSVCAVLIAVLAGGAPGLQAAGAVPRYGVTFGQQGNEVDIQVVPARAEVATNTMPKPGDSSVTGIVGAPTVRPTAAVPPKGAEPPVQLKSQSVSTYKEDGFEVSIDDIEGEVLAGDLDTAGKLSLAILFDNDSRQVDLADATTVKTLNCLLKMLRDRPTLKITVEGFVDYTGVMEWRALGQAPDYGQAASEDRAYAVKKWLVDNGISSLRVTSVGKGMRGAEGDSDAQRKLNRRVDILKVSE